MDGSTLIPERVESDRARIAAEWRASRHGDGEEYARLAADIEGLVLVFVEFLRSPESVETFSRGGETRTMMAGIARRQYDLGRDAVGVIEDFRALRRGVYRSVEEGVDFASLDGGEVARFFAKFLQAYDWMAERGLEAFEKIVHEKMEEELGVAAATDLVTGLPERDLFDRILLPRGIASGGDFALVVFDVVGFTAMISDGRVADARRTLHKLSEAVKATAPENAVCARFGADEICALLPGADGESAYEFAEKVVAAAEGFEVDVGISEHASGEPDAAEMIRDALHALSVAKRAGGGGIIVAKESTR